MIERFEEYRDHLHAVAYRMLGSAAEADDAVQETWLRLSRADADEVANLGGWLTTVVSRICLDMLRSRASRREQPLDAGVPDPVVARDDPEQQAVLADSVGMALLVVLQRLAPPERIAFVLHDMFGIPFQEIAPIVDRTPTATRQLASRARRRVRGGAGTPDADLARRREVVRAFHAASRDGDLAGLIAVLDPDVVLHGDGGVGAVWQVRGAERVARQASLARVAGLVVRQVLVNGSPGLVATRDGEPFSVLAFTVEGDRITQLDVLTDPVRLARLDLAGVLD